MEDIHGKRKPTPSVRHHVEVADKCFNIFAWTLIQMKKYILSFVMQMRDLKLSLRTATVSPALQGKEGLIEQCF